MPRERKSAGLRLVEGNRSKRKVRKEPKFDGQAKCPRSLPLDVKKEWKKRAGQLKKAGLLTEADAPAFAAYCAAIFVMETALKVIENGGILAETGSGNEKQHPAVQTFLAAADRVVSYGSRFGLSPRDRAGLAVPEKPKQTLEDLLR